MQDSPSWNEADHQGIESCTSGEYSTGAADTCVDCASGKTCAAGCRPCLTCGLGKYQTAVRSPTAETQCGDCVAGKASFGRAVSECTTCSSDVKYSDGTEHKVFSLYALAMIGVYWRPADVLLAFEAREGNARPWVEEGHV